MAAVDEFLATILEPLREAEIAIHEGDAAPRVVIWSHADPVSVFGAARNAVGWAESTRSSSGSRRGSRGATPTSST